MGGTFFDEEEAKKQFNEYDKNGSGDLTLEEFIDYYLQDEEYCRQQIQNHQQLIKEAEKQKVDFTSKLVEAKVSKNFKSTIEH